MKSQSLPRAALVYMTLWPITALITVWVGFLLVSPEYRSDKFAVALGGVLFGETLSFGCGAALTLRGESRKPAFPFSLGGASAVTIYLLGTLALALVAGTPISYQWLLALHLAWFLLLTLTAGGFALATPHVEALTESHRQSRAPHLLFREQLAGVVDRVSLIERPEAQPLRDALAHFQDDAAYATSESLPGSESLDSEMSDRLCAIEQKIQKLEQVCADAGTEPSPAIGEKVGDLVGEVKRLKQVLDRRERKMAELR